MSARCALCGAVTAVRLRVRGHAIHRCRGCDLEFVHPPPDEGARARVYDRGYFVGRADGAGYTDYFGAERREHEAKARDRVARIARLAPPAGPWLDVGCADGRFLLEARASGAVVAGVEPSREARAALPRELAEHVSENLAAAAARGPFAVVTLWDVLEHLPAPLDTLAALRTMLVPGALVGIVVPVIDNANARWMPSQWDQYKPPEHLWFFSQRSLHRAVERALGGCVAHAWSAWERPARVTDAALALRGPLGRLAGCMEGAAWRTLVRARVVNPARLLDAAGVVVRTGATT